MRLLIDSLIALMLVGILVGVLYHHRSQTQQLEHFEQVHHALARLHEQTHYHGAFLRSSQTGHHEPSYPLAISPLWFTDEVPLNTLVPGRQPWIDVAPPGDLSAHPPDPVVLRPEQAGFWYNPNRGIFRARVTAQLTEAETLRLYNRVNGTALIVLPTEDTQTRQPSPMPIPIAEDPGDGMEGSRHWPTTTEPLARQQPPAATDDDARQPEPTRPRPHFLGMPPPPKR